MLEKTIAAQPLPVIEIRDLVNRYTDAAKNPELAITLKKDISTLPTDAADLENYIAKIMDAPALGIKLRLIARDEAKFEKILLALLDLDCLQKAYLIDQAMPNTCQSYYLLANLGRY